MINDSYDRKIFYDIKVINKKLCENLNVNKCIWHRNIMTT